MLVRSQSGDVFLPILGARCMLHHDARFASSASLDCLIVLRRSGSSSLCQHDVVCFGSMPFSEKAFSIPEVVKPFARQNMPPPPLTPFLFPSVLFWLPSPAGGGVTFMCHNSAALTLPKQGVIVTRSLV